MARVCLCVDVGVFGKEQGDDLLAVAPRAGHVQSGPAGSVGGVDVEVFGLHEGLDDGEVVVGYGPVEGEALVGVAEGGEFGVGGEEGFDF